MTWNSLLYIIKLIPALKSAWDSFISWYVKKEIDKMKEDDKKALRKAVDEQDQRDLERQMFSIEPGAKSNLPGTTIRTELPNVGMPSAEASGDKRNSVVE